MKYQLKILSKFFGIEYYSQVMWFKYLALKNHVSFQKRKGKITVSKDNRRVIIKCDDKKFGSLGLVVRDFEGFFNAVEPEKTGAVSTVDYSKEKLFKIKDSPDQFYFHSICEPPEVTNIYIESSKAKEGDVIFDIGAYSGTQTVYWSKLVGRSGKVVCFEPDKISFNVLLKNLELHQCKNVLAFDFGVYNVDGQLNFSGGGEMGSKISAGEVLSENSIKVRRLDSIFYELGLQKLDFIKMDIEGSETEVLKSSVDLILKYKPRFIIEPHFVNGKINTKEILDFFQTNNYSSKIIMQGVFDYQPLIVAEPVIA